MSEAGRVIQPAGTRGSLRWIQQAVAERWPDLEQAILADCPAASRIEWLSPLADDDFAEYRDGAFLARLGVAEAAAALAELWPSRGPQWDALARTDAGQLLLVEAKAHIAELCSPGTAAAPASRAKIEAALQTTAASLGAIRGTLWSQLFYQFANRLVHLAFLRDQGHDARLVLVNFLGDSEMTGPQSAEAWEAAYAVMHHAMGLPRRHRLAAHIIHVYPDVRR